MNGDKNWVLLGFLFAAVAAPAQAEARTVVQCIDQQGNAVGRAKPRSCDFYDAQRTYKVRSASAGEVYVVHMHWRTWGGRTAKARGTFAGNMGYRRKGRVTLSGRRRCVGYGHIYTHFRMRLRGGDVFSFRLPGCA